MSAGSTSVPKARAQGVAGGAGDGAGAGVDVVGADDRAGDLAHEVVFFVRGEWRGEEADRVRAVLLADLGEAGGGELHGFVPGRRSLEPAIAPDAAGVWRRSRVLDGVVVEAAADAELVAADGVGVRVRAGRSRLCRAWRRARSCSRRSTGCRSWRSSVRSAWRSTCSGAPSASPSGRRRCRRRRSRSSTRGRGRPAPKAMRVL